MNYPDDEDDDECSSHGRPHANDTIRWLELIRISGIIVIEIDNEDTSHIITVDEFMKRVEVKLAKKRKR